MNNLNIDNGTKVISNNRYFGNAEIEHIAVADSVMEIGVGAFSNCKNLKTVNLKEINLPNTLQSIGEWAFRGCKSLMVINIPEGVTEICAESFLDCPDLTICAKEGSFAAGYAEKAGIPLMKTDTP